MTIPEQLEIYKAAIKHYRKARWARALFIGENYSTHIGLCYYFRQHYNYIHISELSVIMSLRPIERTDYFWFKRGALNPRIKFLKEAVRECKKLIA